MRAPLPSDFPAALGSLDEPDLPVISIGLPAAAPVAPPPSPPPPPAMVAAKEAAPSPPPAKRAPGGDIELDLPALPSDLPELASDLPALASDLPALASNLPTVSGRGAAPKPAKPAAPAGATPMSPMAPMAGGSFELDLPSPAGGIGLPSPRSPSAGGTGTGIDLPVVASPGLPALASAAGLPVVSAGLPSVSAGLPSPAASLPSPAAGLPVTAGNLPSPANILPTTANILPTPAEVLPAVHGGFGEIELPSLDNPPPPREVPSLAGGFGEIDLPREGAVGGPPRPPPAGRTPAAFDTPGDANTPDFGDLELGNAPPTSHPSGGAHAAQRGAAAGGMTFGELDFGGEDGAATAAAAGGGGAIGVDASPSPPKSLPPAGPGPAAAATAPVSFRPPPAARADRPEAAPKKRSLGKSIAAGVLVLAVLGGATLQLTPYGAYGYLVIGDLLNAKAYAATTSATLAAADKTLGSDTYDDAKAAVEAAAAAHASAPRIKPLAAIAAIVDYTTTVRFGVDGSRASRGKQLVAELAATPDAKYLDVALAAQAAEAGDLDRARKAIDAASRHYPGDPIQLDLALLRGELELVAKDGAAAVGAFTQAVTLASDARGHFGLARGYDLLGDAANTKKEIDATLALSPLHPGALTLRARRRSATVDEVSALKDLSTVLDGPARAKASPSELSNAYAARAWVSLERGAASDAREAFGQAVKLDPRNVAALNGEGRLLLNEGRSTEALARFDTALQFDAASPETIANDAEAKLALESLADAKKQLVDAKQRFPKSIPILLLLGKVEQRLGNNDAAEQDLRTAMSFTDPARPDAVQPYVALSELLSARGHLAEAKVVLDDARKKLPPSAALDRAVGEVNEAQGEYDAAIAQYRSSLAKDPKDVATHFRLAVVLRRIRKFDEAGAELDSVSAVDKDYPGLSLERGLLFEESGHVDQAIDLFKAALAKAPDDPDLELRVGSAYVAIGRPDDALPMLQKVLSKRPNSAEANHYIGRAKMLGGAADQVDALRYLQRAVDLDPNRSEFHIYLAWAANDAQPAKLELARDEIDKALSLDKLSPEAYWQRGVLERMEGAVDDAIKDERRALELRPSRYEAHATLAQCYEDKNDDATAMSEWARAVAGDGADKPADGSVAHPFWRYRYGKLLLEHGQSGAAIAQLLPAAVFAEKDTGPRPGWLAPLEFLTAEALRKSGRNKDALEHYRRFLEIAPVSSPDRADAQHYVGQLTGGR
jgi:tetratricopeptide (TPR) repeat protein